MCDAHPELMRAAREVGQAHRRSGARSARTTQIRLVSYVFGPRLPAFGRCITKASELRDFNRRAGSFTCYVVEVCPSCGWNHLFRTWALGRGEPARKTAT